MGRCSIDTRLAVMHHGVLGPVLLGTLAGAARERGVCRMYCCFVGGLNILVLVLSEAGRRLPARPALQDGLILEE